MEPFFTLQYGGWIRFTLSSIWAAPSYSRSAIGVAGVKHWRLDIFGVLVLSFAAANAGGIARDVMIGATPVAALSDWRYVAVSLAAGLLLTFYCYPFIDRLSGSVLIFDAAGLALFAVTGTTKALAYHLNPVAAALLGMLTGIGGGVMRDILTVEVPVVLRADLLRRCSPGWRCRRGDRTDAACSVRCGHDRWRSSLLWAPLYGDPIWLEASGCSRRKTTISRKCPQCFWFRQ